MSKNSNGWISKNGDTLHERISIRYRREAFKCFNENERTNDTRSNEFSAEINIPARLERLETNSSASVSVIRPTGGIMLLKSAVICFPSRCCREDARLRLVTQPNFPVAARLPRFVWYRGRCNDKSQENRWFWKDESEWSQSARIRLKLIWFGLFLLFSFFVQVGEREVVKRRLKRLAGRTGQMFCLVRKSVIFHLACVPDWSFKLD